MLVSMIKREYEPLEQYLAPGLALIIYGPRRVGKTTLLYLDLLEKAFVLQHLSQAF